MELSLFSSENLQSIGPQMFGIPDFTHFSLRLFDDRPNYFSDPHAPKRAAMTPRKGFKNFKETRVFPWAKTHRDRKFRNLENMFALAETVFPSAASTETAFPLAGRQGRPGAAALVTRTRNEKFV